MLPILSETASPPLFNVGQSDTSRAWTSGNRNLSAAESRVSTRYPFAGRLTLPRPATGALLRSSEIQTSVRSIGVVERLRISTNSASTISGAKSISLTMTSPADGCSPKSSTLNSA